ncbi:MAG: type I restriction enzyme HsdR N-terminal domain-containing protein [Bacteroidetes bacterium]|nr:type I restriction enzyme HsdR N-terminal domain-containing protein [Bacteroidota bacterium]
MFDKLNFPGYNFKIIIDDQNTQSSKVFDIIRRKYVSLTPEEWVRQHLIHFMVHEKGFPKSLIQVEKKILVNNLSRRTDIVVCDRQAKPLLVAECKAPSVKISQETFDQAARYNLSLQVKYFVLSNGKDTFCCIIDHQKQEYRFLEFIPSYPDLLPG